MALDFFGIGILELGLAFLVALVFLGPARMVKGARSAGRFARRIQDATRDIPQLLNLEELDQPLESDARAENENNPSD